MYVLGLTGSLAMGKTTVATMFEELGVPVFHSDQAVHSLFEKSKRLKKEISESFPSAVKKGSVDRAILRKQVFGNRIKLARLETIVHPAVIREARKFIKKYSHVKLVVVDMPLLFEIGADDLFDGVAVVSASPALQRKRAFARPDMTEEHFDMILRRQLPDVEKCRRADFVINTGSTQKETRAEVTKLVTKLKRLSQ